MCHPFSRDHLELYRSYLVKGDQSKSTPSKLLQHLLSQFRSGLHGKVRKLLMVPFLKNRGNALPLGGIPSSISFFKIKRLKLVGGFKYVITDNQVYGNLNGHVISLSSAPVSPDKE